MISLGLRKNFVGALASMSEDCARYTRNERTRRKHVDKAAEGAARSGASMVDPCSSMTYADCVAASVIWKAPDTQQRHLAQTSYVCSDI